MQKLFINVPIAAVVVATVFPAGVVLFRSEAARGNVLYIVPWFTLTFCVGCYDVDSQNIAFILPALSEGSPGWEEGNG